MSSNNAVGSNQYQSKKKGSKIITIIAVIIGLVIGGRLAYPSIKQFINNVDIVNNYSSKPVVEAPKPTQEEVKASDIEKRMNEVKTRADHKAKVAKFDETEARRVATAEYEKAEADKYALVKAEIEKSKAQVRQDEVSF